MSLDETVVDHLDIAASGASYRVFLLASTLQVDLSFWPHGHFVTGGSPIRLLFGEADDTSVVDRGEEGMHYLRMTWLYALHVRSAVARGRSWQSIWMLEQIRNQLISMYCSRFDLPTHEGRGVDALPGHVRAGLCSALIVRTDSAALVSTFRTLVGLVLDEAMHQGIDIPVGLDRTLAELAASAESARP